MAMYFVDRFKGGVTASGWSPPCDSFGTGFFSISIPAGCTIRKAFLFATQEGNATTVTVNLTGATLNSYTFDATTRIGTGFRTPYSLPTLTSWVHAIDITANISPTTNNYTLTVPSQISINQRFTGFYLVVEFANNAMDICNVCIYLNHQDTYLAYNITHNLSFPIPIDTSGHVAVAPLLMYTCNDTINGNGNHDAENIEVNNTLLGHVGSTTGNGGCSGSGYIPPRGDFTYSNSTLTALGLCNANLAVSGQDALTQINSLLTNGATSFSIEFNAEEVGNYSNGMWLLVVAYTDAVPPPFPYECAAPTPSMSLITQTTARVSWISGAPCGGVNADYNVQYRVIGSPTWIVVPVSLVLQYDIVGLTTLTNYEVQIVPTACGAPPAVCAPSSIIDFQTI